MADYYIVGQNSKKDQISVVYHIPIPEVNNFVGVPFSLAITQSREPESELPDIFGENDLGLIKGQVVSGNVFEISRIVNVDANLTKAQKRDLIEADYMQVSGALIDKLKDELDFWGFQGNV